LKESLGWGNFPSRKRGGKSSRSQERRIQEAEDYYLACRGEKKKEKALIYLKREKGFLSSEGKRSIFKYRGPVISAKKLTVGGVAEDHIRKASPEGKVREKGGGLVCRAAT